MNDTPNAGRIFKLDRNRRLRFTQRSKYRMSNSGLTAEQLSQGTRSFANVCAFLYALIDEPNPQISLEDIAVSIEGREDEAAEVAVECLIDAGIIQRNELQEEGAEAGGADDPKLSGLNHSRSPESTSE